MKKKMQSTLEDDFKLYEKKDGGFKMSKSMKAKLLETQMNTALNGSSEMLKWLGKNYLGQQEPKKDESSNESKPLIFCEYGLDMQKCPRQAYLEHIGEADSDDYKEFLEVWNEQQSNS